MAPCTLFSNASFKRDPTKGNILAQKTLEIMEHFKKLNPKLIWFIENPWSSLLKKQENATRNESKVVKTKQRLPVKINKAKLNELSSVIKTFH